MEELSWATVVLAVGRVNITIFDIAEGDVSVWILVLDLVWLSRIPGASAPANTWLRWISISGIVTVQPEHVHIMVVPNGHHESHTVGESSRHLSHTSKLLEVVNLSKVVLLSIAEGITEAVVGLTVNGHGWGVDHLAILDVLSLDVGDDAVVGSVVS